MNEMTESQRSWKKEPMVWMLIAIPGAAVVMGMVMLTLAIQTWSGLVVDDYYRHGKQINRVLARDRFAWELGLAATLELEADELRVRFDPSVTVIPEGEIELSLVHATMPGLDQTLTLRRVEARVLQADLDLPGPGRWNLALQTADWRLTGSLRYPQQSEIRLTPDYRPR